MTNTQINQIIHEARGLCWHEFDYVSYSKCLKCEKEEGISTLNPDYTSWSDYGEALEWAQRQKWWTDFAYKVRQVLPTHYIMASFLQDDLLIPIKGSTALAEFIVAHLEFFKKEVENEP